MRTPVLAVVMCLLARVSVAQHCDPGRWNNGSYPFTGEAQGVRVYYSPDPKDAGVNSDGNVQFMVIGLVNEPGVCTITEEREVSCSAQQTRVLWQRTYADSDWPSAQDSTYEGNRQWGAYGARSPIGIAANHFCGVMGQLRRLAPGETVRDWSPSPPEERRPAGASPVLSAEGKDAQACNGADMQACYELGRLYARGEGVAQDYARAVQLYDQACKGGVTFSCTNLGVSYELGNGVAQDYARALQLYDQACNEGDMLGCHNLGALYEGGRGVAQDYARARQLYFQACNVGEMRGCNDLGVLYENGHGGVQDYAQARLLYERACRGGLELACGNVRRFRQ